MTTFMRGVPEMVGELQERALPVSSHPDECQSECPSRAARRNAVSDLPRFESSLADSTHSDGRSGRVCTPLRRGGRVSDARLVEAYSRSQMIVCSCPIQIGERGKSTNRCSSS